MMGGWLSLADAPADITISSETRFSLNGFSVHTHYRCAKWGQKVRRFQSGILHRVGMLNG